MGTGRQGVLDSTEQAPAEPHPLLSPPRPRLTPLSPSPPPPSPWWCGARPNGYKDNALNGILLALLPTVQTCLKPGHTLTGPLSLRLCPWREHREALCQEQPRARCRWSPVPPLSALNTLHTERVPAQGASRPQCRHRGRLSGKFRVTPLGEALLGVTVPSCLEKPPLGEKGCVDMSCPQADRAPVAAPVAALSAACFPPRTTW